MAGVIWLYRVTPGLPVVSAPEPTISPVASPPLTPFQLDARLKAIQQVDDVVTGPIEASQDQRTKLWQSAFVYIGDGSFDRRPAEFDGAYKSAFAEFERTLRNLDTYPEVVTAGADNAFNVGFHEKLQNALSNGTQKVAFAALLQARSVAICRRSSWCPRSGMKFANSTLTANRGDHPSSTIAGGGKSTTESAGNYTTCVDATKSIT
jgi:hypothetical protein